MVIAGASSSPPPLISPSSQARRFTEAVAFPDSVPLHRKNPQAVAADLRRLAYAGRLRDALTVLDYAEQRGVPLSQSPFSALLAAAARKKNSRAVRQIHVHLNIHGHQRNEFLLSKLIEAYAACGKGNAALRFLSSSPELTHYSWNALLRGNVVAGVDVARVFDEMRAKGVQPNEYTYGCLLKSAAGSGRLWTAATAHALLVKNAFAGEPTVLMSALVDVYFKCGKVKHALKLFDEMPEKDIVAFGAAIAGCVHKGLKREAMHLLRRMLKEGAGFNSVIATSVLPVIGELSDRDAGREIHCYLLKRIRKFRRLESVQSALIDMYCKCGDMASGRRVFYASLERNVVSWTALMSGYASNGRFEQALRSLTWMQREGVRPDVVAVATALPVCTELRAAAQGKELHAYALKRWFFPNVSLATSLLTMYAACGDLWYSRRVFDTMPSKTVIAWTALINSHVKSAHPEHALELFRAMQLAGCRPDGIAVAAALAACGELSAGSLGKELHALVVKTTASRTPPTVSAALIRMYGACRNLSHARKVFDRVQSKGSLTCTAIIQAYAVNRRGEEALNLLTALLEDGFVPNKYTLDVALEICGAAELPGAAVRIVETMVREYDITPSPENYESVISLLARSGRSSEAQRFITQLNSLP